MFRALPVLILLIAACGGDGGGEATEFVPRPPDPRALEAFLREARAAVRDGDAASAAPMLAAHYPDGSTWSRILRDDLEAGLRDRVIAAYRRARPPKDDVRAWVALLGPCEAEGELVVVAEPAAVVAAPGAATRADGFTGDARRAAGSLLRGDVTVAAVEVRHGPPDTWLRYPCFAWDGERWAMLGPVGAIVATADPPLSVEPVAPR